MTCPSSSSVVFGLQLLVGQRELRSCLRSASESFWKATTCMSRRPGADFFATGWKLRSRSSASTGSRSVLRAISARKRSSRAFETSTFSGTANSALRTRTAVVIALPTNGDAPSSRGFTASLRSSATIESGLSNRRSTTLRASAPVRPPTSIPAIVTPGWISFGPAGSGAMGVVVRRRRRRGRRGRRRRRWCRLVRGGHRRERDEKQH